MNDKKLPKIQSNFGLQNPKNEIENRGYESYLTSKHHISDAGRNPPYAAALLLPGKFCQEVKVRIIKSKMQ
jgi:hypothetical protein